MNHSSSWIYCYCSELEWLCGWAACLCVGIQKAPGCYTIPSTQLCSYPGHDHSHMFAAWKPHAFLLLAWQAAQTVETATYEPPLCGQGLWAEQRHWPSGWRWCKMDWWCLSLKDQAYLATVCSFVRWSCTGFNCCISSFDFLCCTHSAWFSHLSHLFQTFSYKSEVAICCVHSKYICKCICAYTYIFTSYINNTDTQIQHTHTHIYMYNNFAYKQLYIHILTAGSHLSGSKFLKHHTY